MAGKMRVWVGSRPRETGRFQAGDQVRYLALVRIRYHANCSPAPSGMFRVLALDSRGFAEGGPAAMAELARVAAIFPDIRNAR